MPIPENLSVSAEFDEVERLALKSVIENAVKTGLVRDFPMFHALEGALKKIDFTEDEMAVFKARGERVKADREKAKADNASKAELGLVAKS